MNDIIVHVLMHFHLIDDWKKALKLKTVWVGAVIAILSVLQLQIIPLFQFAIPANVFPWITGVLGTLLIVLRRLEMPEGLPMSWRLHSVYMSGALGVLLDNVDNQPYWRYVAVMDGRTRPAHRALHGKVWRWDDPIWQVIFPPNGWGCRCRVQALSEEEFKRLGVPLEDGSKAVDTIQVPINKAGDTMDVRVVRFTDETGREQIFRPDPGWDYNPGADYASEQALSRVLADKVDKADPETAAAVAATISASPQAQQLLDGAWQSWADDVLDDPAEQNRQMLTGFVRPEDVAALAERDLDVSNVAIVADDTAIAGGKTDSPAWASDSPSPADWIGLSASLREPQAVLLDKADGSLLYVLPSTGDETQRMVVAVSYGASRSKALAANLQWAYLTLLRDLVDAADGDGFELLGGSLD